MSPTIQLADRAALDPRIRRTRRLRLAVALLLIATAVAVVVATRASHPRPVGVAGVGSNGIVVLDLSASISSDTYERIGATLGRLSDSGGRFGLILFSDTAYQALAPGTPAAELRSFERFFAVPPQTTPGLQPALPVSPWRASFSAGTRISTGLQLALATIRDQHLGRPTVLLVSDLDDDDGDLESLTEAGLAFRHLGIPLKVVGLNPAPEDERLVDKLLPQTDRVVRAGLPGEEGSGLGRGRAGAIVVAATALAAALALFTLTATRLRLAVPR